MDCPLNGTIRAPSSKLLDSLYTHLPKRTWAKTPKLIQIFLCSRVFSLRPIIVRKSFRTKMHGTCTESSLRASTKQVSNIQDSSYQSLQLIPLWILVSILPVCPSSPAVRRNWWWHEFDGGLEARQVVDSEGKQESLATRVVTVEKPKISTGDFWMHLEHVYVENISWLRTQ